MKMRHVCRNEPMKSVYRSLNCAALFLAAIGLGLGPTTLAAEPSADTPTNARNIFDSNRVVKIDITLAPADWEKLRNQERDIANEFGTNRLERPPKSPYTWFSADVTIDGTQLKNVGIRKRGFIGSADTDRPGLNLEFDKFVKSRNFAGHT